MNCEQLQPIAADLARQQNRGLMDASVRSAAQAHVAECDACAQMLIAQTDLSEGLRKLSDEMKGRQASSESEGKLLATFRAQASRPVENTPSRRRYWTGAIAAMLLIGFAVWAIRVWRSQTASPAQLITQNEEQPLPGPISSPPATPVIETVNPLVPGPPPRTSHERRDRKSSLRLPGKPGPKMTEVALSPVPAAEAESKEIATDFVPVGYGSALDLQDGGQVVRVELPRVALARFGLPMNLDRADEGIKADVLVGADGLARAIRFVK